MAANEWEVAGPDQPPPPQQMQPGEQPWGSLTDGAPASPHEALGAPPYQPWEPAGPDQPPPEPTWAERIRAKLLEREVIEPAGEAIQENVVKPFARGVLRARIFANTATGDFEDMARLNQRIESPTWAASPESQALMQQISEAPSLGEALKLYAQNPGMALQVASESLPMSTASLAGGAAGGFGVGALGGGPAGALVGAAAGTAAGSFATEYLATLTEVAASKGVDMNDAAQLEAAFTDPAFLAEARQRGFDRGIPIAAFDALSMGMAGRAYRAVKSAPGMGGTVGTVAGGVAEAGAQAGFGMAGEAGAQLNADGEITSWGDIASEGVGEIVPGAIEAGIRVGTEGFAGGRQSPGGAAGGARGPDPSPPIPEAAYRGQEPLLEGPPGSAPQPEPTYKAEGQPPYPSDASREERGWFDIMWERSRPQNRSGTERERADQRAGREPPPEAGASERAGPDQPPPDGGAPAAPRSPRALPAPADTESTGADQPPDASFLPARSIPQLGAPAPVEPSAAVDVQPSDEEADEAQVPATRPTDVRTPGFRRWVEGRNAELEAVRGELDAFDRETARQAQESLNEEMRPEDRQSRPVAYQERLRERMEGFRQARSKFRRELEQRQKALTEEVSGAVTEYREAVRPSRLMPVSEWREVTGNKDGKGQKRLRDTKHQQVLDSQSRQPIGTLLWSQKAGGFRLKPDAKLPKDLRAALQERFGSRTFVDSNLNEDTDQIVIFAREFEAGRKDRERTIEGKATDVTPKPRELEADDENAGPDWPEYARNVIDRNMRQSGLRGVTLREILISEGVPVDTKTMPDDQAARHDALATRWDELLADDESGELTNPDIELTSSLPVRLRIRHAPLETGKKGAAADFAARKQAKTPPKAPPTAAKTVIPESRSKRKALICAMCSSTKDAAEGKIRAEERYGPGAVVSAMAKVPQHLRPDILFLSAEFGLIGQDTPIPHYEKKLTKAEADRLIKNKAARAKFIATVRDYDGGKVLIAAGGEYRRVFEAWVEAGTSEFKGVDIQFTDSEIGLMKGAIKSFAIETQPSNTHREFVEAKARKGEVRKEPLSVLAKREPLRQHAKSLADELVEGGGVGYKKDGDVITGRTPSLNPEWAQQLLEAEGVSVKRVKEIAAKLVAGDKMGVVDIRVANTLLEVAAADRAGAVTGGGFRARKAEAIERRYMELLEAYTLQLDFGENPKEAEKLRADMDRMRRRYPAHFGINTAGGVAEPIDSYRVERPVEKGAWRQNRVLHRDHVNLNLAERKALGAFLKGRKDRARILKMLEQHRGTPWAKQAIEGMFTRQAAIELMAGGAPNFVSALDDPRVFNTRRALMRGEAGLKDLMEGNGFLSEATKPVNNISSSFVNCSPSKDCARYCYATGGNYQHTNVIIKAELVTLAIETDPAWAARIAARQYKATSEFENGKALRLFDKGDMGEGWIPFIAALNSAGVRVQVFSRRPELLRQIPDMNVRMLSIDESNAQLAEENQDLPVAYIYSGKGQIPALAKIHQRGQLQVVLPIKQGTAVLTKENVLELRKEVKGIAPYICPIDAGYKPLKTTARPTGWNCLKCDAKGGIGCFFGQPTRGILAEAYPKQRDKAAELEDLRRRLYAYIDEDEGALAEAGQLRAGQPAGQREQIDALLARLMGEHDGRAEVDGDQEADGGARPADDGDRKEPRGVRESGAGYGSQRWYYSPVEQALRQSKLARGTAAQWFGYLKNQPGVKTEELEDTYLDELLNADPKAVYTRDDLLDYVGSYAVQLADVVLRDRRNHPDFIKETKAAQAELERMGIRWERDEQDGDSLLFFNSEGERIYAEDQDLDDETIAAMRKAEGTGQALARYAEYTEPGGTDYFELLITAPTLPAQKRQDDLDVTRLSRASEIRRPIFEKHAEAIQRANATVLALAMDTAGAETVGLPAGWKIDEEARLPAGWKIDEGTVDGTDVTLVSLRDPGGQEMRFQWAGLSGRPIAEARKNMTVAAWEYHRDELEAVRDKEAQRALRAAGIVDDERSKPFKLEGGHFQTESGNIIVHVRADEGVAVDGGRVLRIQEIQSDQAKLARRHGIRKPGDEDGQAKARRLRAARKETLGALIDPLIAEGTLGYDSPSQAIANIEDAESAEAIRRTWDMSEELYRLAAAHHAATEAVREFSNTEREGAVADFPFKKSYNRVAMRRMLRWAAENGFDYVAWTPGEVQGKRYNALTHVEAVRLRAVNDDRIELSVKKPGETTFERLRIVLRDTLADWIGGPLARLGLEKLDAADVKARWSGDPIIRTQIKELQELRFYPIDDFPNHYLTPDGALAWNEINRDNIQAVTLTDAEVRKAGRLAELVRDKIGDLPKAEREIVLDQATTVGKAKGYRDLYDVELVSDTKKFVKRWGGSVGTVQMPGTVGADYDYTVALPDGTRRDFSARWKAEKFVEENPGAKFVNPIEALEWPGLKITPELRAGLLQPLAVYEQGDLFGQQPGRDRRDSPAPARQDDMFGADLERQKRANAMAKAESAKESKLSGDKSIPADINRPGDLFTRQQDLVDAGSQTRPGTNAKQLSLRERALADLERRLGGARRGVQVAAAAIPEDFRAQGSISLAGRAVRSLEELAAVAQVHRDPRFEVLRWIAVKNGVVTHDVAVSARLPAAVMFDTPAQDAALEFYRGLADKGADGWYLLHNHPSGDPQPSSADELFTENLAARVPNFRGHVVVDHDSYGVIDGRGRSRVIDRPGLSAGSYGKTDLVPHGLLGVKVFGPLQLATAAKQAGGPAADAVTVMGIANRGQVRALVTIPVAQLRGARGLAMMSRLMRATGSSRLHVIVQSDPAPVRHLLENGVVTDAYVIDTGKTLSESPGETIFDQTYAQLRDMRRQNLGRDTGPSSRVMEEDEGYGTVNANPLMPAYRLYQRAAQKAIDRWNDVIGWRWDPLGKLPRREDYLTARYLTLGKMTRVREVARGIYDALSKASPADAQAVYDYMTTAGAQPTGIVDPAIRRKAVAVKRLIDRIGRALVLRGALSPAAYAAHRDSYLPRLYLKHILGEEAISGMGSGRRLSDQGYLRRRRNIPLDERVLLGEILDPAFLASYGAAKTMRDLAIMDFLDTLAPQADWVAPQSLVVWKGRRVSPFWLKLEADSLRKRAEFYGPQNKAFAQNVANQMDAAANAGLAQLADISQDFKQLPNSARYGLLRGVWVRKEIHADLVGAMRALPSDSNVFAQLFESGGVGTKVTQIWKQLKVAMNPPAQIRNFLSNVILVHLSGVALWRLPGLYVRAINQIRTHGRYWQIARKYGLFESTFSNTELYRIEREWLDLQRRQGIGKFAVIKQMAGVFADASSDVYQLSEAIGKIAKLIDAMEQDGLSESEAMIEGHKWLFDYSLVPTTVGQLRNMPIGIPFLTFYYKATARLAEAMVKHPARFLPYLAIGWMMAAALRDAWDIDEEEAEKLLQAMPNWIREKSHVWILPFKDENGRWQVLDFGYLVPWGVHVEAAKAIGRGDLKDAAKNLGILSGPVPALFTAYQTGIDPFTQRPIYDENATSQEKLLAMLNYGWSLAAPTFVTSHGWLGKTKDALTGKVNPRTGEPGLTLGQAQLRLIGINVYPVDPEQSRQLNIILLGRQIEDTERALGKRLRDRNLTLEQKREIRETYRGIIKQLQVDLADYKKASAFPRRLLEPEPPRNRQEPEA